MSWPVEYRVLRTKPARPQRIDAEGRPFEAWRSEWVYRDWIVGRDHVGHWDQFTADEADYRLSGFMAEEETIWRKWWPDGVVDVMSELVCIKGYEVQGRYEPQGRFVRLA